MHKFKVVSFYTNDENYIACANRLEASLVKFGLSYELNKIERAEYWEWNCAKIPFFIRDKWAVSDTPIVWVDADATIERSPDLFDAAAGYDFGVHKWNNNHFGGGTLYFGKTPGAKKLLDLWCEKSESDPTTWTQKVLEAAWEELVGHINTYWLPRSYLQIFDQPTHGLEPVIKHWQASRVEKLAGRNLVQGVVGER